MTRGCVNTKDRLECEADAGGEAGSWRSGSNSECLGRHSRQRTVVVARGDGNTFVVIR